MRKPGCIEPVIYWRRPDGFLILAPSSQTPCPDAFIREEADTLAAVDRLEKVLQYQEAQAAESELILDMGRVERRSEIIRDHLYQRMTSGDCPQWEKDFIREYLKLRNERKRQQYAERHRKLWYLYSRHNDSGDRRVDSEEFRVDKHTVID